jgi:hypothetical protein
MVEFAVSATVLAVLPLGMVLLGRYHDLQMTAIQAARYSVFDSTWWRDRRSAAEAQQLLRDRLFAESSWKDPWGAENLIDAQSDVHRESTEGAPPGRSAAVTRFILRPLVAVSGFLGDRFDVDQNGFHTAQLRVSVRDQHGMPAPLDALGIELHESAALLGDAWNASGPAHVRQRVSGLVATSLAAEARSLLRPLDAPIALIEPAVRRLCWGRIDPEVVPADRLAPIPRAAATNAGANAC